MPKFGAVKLLKQIKINASWKLVPALFDTKGRVRRDHVRVQGRDEVHEEGCYYLEWWEAGKRTREPGGPDAFIAAEKARHKQARTRGLHSGIVTPAHDNGNGHTALKTALDEYEEYIRFHRSLRTFRTYRPILRSFRTFCRTTHIENVERQDLLDFATDCLKKGQQGKSIYNKLVVVSQVMKQHGKPKLLQAADWPSFVETVRPIYEDSELQALFKACNPAEQMRFKFYLMSGFRDAGGRFVTWRDVDFKNCAVRLPRSRTGDFIPRTGKSGKCPCRKN
jgi:integrase/recombinase XerD